uniref:Uncharacterized protein n=1 Tax=Ixodes ricinus TaxID=34613 RepID=A0A6B0UE20_IXORI
MPSISAFSGATSVTTGLASSSSAKSSSWLNGPPCVPTLDWRPESDVLTFLFLCDTLDILTSPSKEPSRFAPCPSSSAASAAGMKSAESSTFPGV